MENSILQLFPSGSRALWQSVAKEQAGIQEIRLRTGKPVIIHRKGKELFLTDQGRLSGDPAEGHLATGRELSEMLEHICHYSPYAFEEELRQGFLTVAGGHRVGVAGQAVMEADGRVRTFKNISYLNIRVSHQVKGAADKVLSDMYREGGLRSALIISPPGCGKTTLLRDLIRQISDGNAYGQGMTVGVVDERSELAGSFLGKPQNDMGMRTDVLDGCPKDIGMLLLLRAMSPQVIALDELALPEDVEAVRAAAGCGVVLLATVHAASVAELSARPLLRGVLESGVFRRAVVIAGEDRRCRVEALP